ncbi:MAG: tetratricopeptide repeat protein [bacterium]
MRKTISASIFVFTVALFLCAQSTYCANYKDHVNTAKSYLTECRHKEKAALEEMKKAYKLNPKNADVLFWLGRALYDNRKYKEAAKFLEKALEINPDDIETNAYLSYTYGRIGENIVKRTIYMTKSINRINKILSLDPNYADAYFSLAIGCTYLGWYEKPTGVFRSLVKLIFKDEKLVDQFSAEMLYKKAIELDPKDPWHYAQLGWLYLKRDKKDDAKKVFKKAIELASKDIKCGMKDDSVPRGIAINYEEAEMFSEALEYAKLALEWNPNDLALEPRLSLKTLIERLEKEKKLGKPLMKNVADEL